MVGGGVLRVLGKYGFDIDFDIVFRKYMVEIMEVVLLLFSFSCIVLLRTVNRRISSLASGEKCFKSDNFYESYIRLRGMDGSVFFFFLKNRSIDKKDIAKDIAMIFHVDI